MAAYYADTSALRIWSVQYEIIDMKSSLVDETRVLLEHHPLRAYDAIQLASALHASRILQVLGKPLPIFLAADSRLLAAAQAEGLMTDNPNLH